MIVVDEIEFDCRYNPDDTVYFHNFPEFTTGEGAALYVTVEEGGDHSEAKLNRQDVKALRKFLKQWLKDTK